MLDSKFKQIAPVIDIQRRRKQQPLNNKVLKNQTIAVLDRDYNGAQRREQNKLYNPDQIPPDFEQAAIHREATMVGPEKAILFANETEDGKTDFTEQLSQEKFCICCVRKTDKIKLSLNCNLKELAYIGSGFPLYFTFIKLCSYMILAILLTSGFFNMATNYLYGKNCVEEDKIVDVNRQCQLDIITMFSLGNKKDQEELINLQSYLNIAGIGLMIIFMQIYRGHIRKMDVECDMLDISSKDYTIWVQNMPTHFQAFNNDYDEDLQKILEEEVCNGDPKYRISNINLTYNLQDVYKLQKQKDKLLKEKAKIVWYQHKQGFYQPGRTIGQINLEIKEIQKIIDSHLNKFYHGKETEFMARYFTGQAFVSFSDPQVKDIFVEKYSKTSFFQNKPKIMYHGNQLKIISAPDPLNVFWPNLHIKDQLRREFLSYSIIFSICAGAFFGIYYYNETVNDLLSDTFQGSDSIQLGLTFIISLIINGFNMIILIIGKKLSNYQQQQTKTLYNIRAIQLISLGQFIVTTVIIYIISLLVNKEGDAYGQTFKNRGLAYKSMIIIIGNTIIPFMIEVLDLKALPRKYKQYKIRNKAKEDIPILKTQEKLNKLYEHMDFDIIYRYTVILKTMYVCAFYAAIVPMALLWGLLSLLLTYWVDKYNLIRRRAVLQNLSSEIVKEMTDILEYCVLLFAVGNYLARYLQIGDVDINNFYKSFVSLGVGIAFLHICLPTQMINNKIFTPPENLPNEDTYEISKLGFLTDYQRENPATREASRQQHMKRVQELQNKYQSKHGINTNRKTTQFTRQQLLIMRDAEKNKRKNSFQISEDIASDSENMVTNQQNSQRKINERQQTNYSGFKQQQNIVSEISSSKQF